MRPATSPGAAAPSFSATRSSASSQLALTSCPSLRTSGSSSRARSSGSSTANRPRLHRRPRLGGTSPAPVTLITSPSRRWTTVWQPMPQCGQVVRMRCSSQLRATPLRGALGERPDRADVHALAAELALLEVRQRVPVLAAGALGAPAGGMRHHAVDLDRGAGGPAAAAEDALGVVADDVAVFHERELVGAGQVGRRLDLVLVGEPAELALAEGVAGDAGVAAGVDEELERRPARAAARGRSWSGRPCPRWPACCRQAAACPRRPPRPRRGGTRHGGPPRAGSRASGWRRRWRSPRRGWSGRARSSRTRPSMVICGASVTASVWRRHLRPPPRRCGSSAGSARPRAARRRRSPAPRPRRSTGCGPPAARPWDAASRCCR